MAVLGKGTAHGACSLLHAAALGYGASLALNLKLTAKLLDKPSKRELHDDDGVLDAVLQTWLEENLPLPQGLKAQDMYWGVDSEIPPKQGLKSSSATCIAAIRALCDATSTTLSPPKMVEIAAKAQLAAGVSLTGSIDDAWACMTPGWKLVDVQAPIEDGVLVTEDIFNADEWIVLVILRGKRDVMPTIDDFTPHLTNFQQALEALQHGNPLVALTCNGRGMAAVLKDIEGRKLTNDSFMNSARAAGITGSGPAIVIVVPRQQQNVVQRIKSWYSSRSSNIEILETTILDAKTEDEVE